VAVFGEEVRRRSLMSHARADRSRPSAKFLIGLIRSKGGTCQHDAKEKRKKKKRLDEWPGPAEGTLVQRSPASPAPPAKDKQRQAGFSRALPMAAGPCWQWSWVKEQRGPDFHAVITLGAVVPQRELRPFLAAPVVEIPNAVPLGHLLAIAGAALGIEPCGWKGTLTGSVQRCPFCWVKPCKPAQNI